MPLYYTKPLEEHHAVRNKAGVFDISHMGQFWAEGPRAEDFLHHALPNDVRAMTDGQALYSPLCRQDGGVLDDLIIYRYSQTRYRIIVNADTREKDFAWLTALAGLFGVRLTDVSTEHCLFAVQGPQALALLQPHTKSNLAALKYFHFVDTAFMGVSVFMARTGYTGEPGVEMSVPLAQAQKVWEAITDQLGIGAIGLAARDTLRLEAALPLYGHELRESWHPLESGVGWAVKLGGDEDFIGKREIQEHKARGSEYKLVGLEITGRGIPRAEYLVTDGQNTIGEVTSGTQSPTTGKAIALAHIKATHAAVGTQVFVVVRDKPVEAQVVSLPFYRNPAIRA